MKKLGIETWARTDAFRIREGFAEAWPARQGLDPLGGAADDERRTSHGHDPSGRSEAVLTANPSLRDYALDAVPGFTRHGQPAAYLFKKHVKSLTFSTGPIVEPSQLA